MYDRMLQELRRLRALGDPRKVVVYYRQSNEAQIGNVSTTLQTVQMIDLVEQAGWWPEDRLLVDQDGGVSGMLSIEDRAGMSYLMYEMMEKNLVSLVVVQAVDRLFRDEDQIDTNRFIKVCRVYNVQVLTPETLFDFNDPRYGEMLANLFRELTGSAAAFIKHHVRGRLHVAREKEIREGKWSGQGLPTGYMTDIRKLLPDGIKNPDYHQIFVFEPYAVVVVAIFELFVEKEGNLLKTWQAMENGRLSFPELKPGMIPEGFRIVDQLKRRSRVTGARVPAYTSLIGLLTNLFYLGYFPFKGEILFTNHHPKLVPEDLFWYTFNRLSKTMLDGSPNPNYIPHRPMVRHSSKDRPVAPPIFAGMIFSDDLLGWPHRRLITQWTQTTSCYVYRLAIPTEQQNYWAISAPKVDALIGEMERESLEMLELDRAAWKAALQRWTAADHRRLQQLEQELRDEEQAKENVLSGIRTYSNEDLRQRAEDNLKAINSTIAVLKGQQEVLFRQLRDKDTLKDVRTVLNKIIARWDRVPDHYKRELLELLAVEIQMSQMGRRRKCITIYWKSGAVTSRVLSHVNGRGQPWSAVDRDNLKYLIEHHVDQVEILRHFPDLTWRNLLDQYAYHFNNGSREGVYQGKKTYSQYARWEDTEEYWAEWRGEDNTSYNDRTEFETRSKFPPFDWFDLTNPLVLNVLRAMAAGK